MNVIWYRIAKFLAASLDAADREAVLGDLTEAREPAHQAVLSLLGLVTRRQLAALASWRGLITLIGITAASWMVAGAAIEFNTTIQHWITPPWKGKGPAFPLAWRLSNLAQLSVHIAVWAWTSSYAMARVSPRTVGTSLIFFYLTMVYLPVFRMLPYGYMYPNWLHLPFLVIVLAPAIWGAASGLQHRQSPLFR